MRRLLLVLMLALFAAPAARAEPPRHGEHEILYHRPSGFWTSNRPAPPGQQYKWRLLEIGVAVGLLTGLLLARTIKRANAERVARAAHPDPRAPLPGARTRLPGARTLGPEA